MANRRRPEADDLLRMAEYRRSMQALRKVSDAAVDAAVRTRHLHAVPAVGIGDGSVSILPVGEPGTAGPDTPEPTVVSLAAARARRVGHPAGSLRRS